MLNSSFWPIDKTLSVAATLGQVDQEIMVMRGYTMLPKASTLLEPQNQIV